MFSSQASIFHQALSGETFERLCCLWQQMAEILGEEAVLISENTLFPSQKMDYGGNLGAKLPPERFRVLIMPKFSALLVGKSLPEDSSYQVSLTFSPQAIVDFLSQLHQQLDDRPTQQTYLQKHINQLLIQMPECVNPQSQFTLKLMEILASENSSLSPPELDYSCLSSPQPLQEVLTHQLEQERILDRVALQINQNLDWLAIVKMTIEQVQRLLEVDRLVVYQLDVELKSEDKDSPHTRLIDAVTYEARASESIPSILHFRDEICFSNKPQCRNKYRQGFNLVINDLNKADNITPCLRLLMERLEVRAKLVAPIVVQKKLWGFLIAHQCWAPRQRQQGDVKFLQQVTEYLAIAIYQARCYKQLQEQKNILQLQVNKRAKELKDALLAAQVAHRSKSDFLGNMSHELRTPLTCVIGLSSTLLHWLHDTQSLPLDKQRQYLQTIHDSGQHLLELVNDILEFSQVEAGKSLLNITEFSLRYLSISVVQDLQKKADKKQINLELDFQIEIDKIGDRFRADRERVEQILVHLLDNAIKFTPNGGTVILRVWRESKQAVFQVEDTGIGISQQQIPLMFEKFQQLEKSRQRTHGGTGLGLALTQQLVELHRGRIEVESIPDRGSLFTVWLPDQLNFKSKIVPNASVKTQPFSGKGTVVLLEKDEQEATLICELLTAGDYQVVWLIDGSIAIRQIELLQPASVIISRDLPDVGQISQALKELRTTKKIKLILLSSQTISSDDWQYFSERGIDDYLLKPIQPNRLLDKINMLMSS